MRRWTHGLDFAADGDFVVYGYWNDEGFWEVNFWLIPNSQIED